VTTKRIAFSWLQALMRDRDAAVQMLDEVKLDEEARMASVIEQNEKLRRLTKEQDEAIAALQKVSHEYPPWPL